MTALILCMLLLAYPLLRMTRIVVSMQFVAMLLLIIFLSFWLLPFKP